MSKRYREAIEVGERDPAAPSPPVRFTWRGRRYEVVAVLGHWREDAAWWAGGASAVPQRDLWRVEARAHPQRSGVFELVQQGEGWLLDRVWD